jgi:hypothetical protein
MLLKLTFLCLESCCSVTRRRAETFQDETCTKYNSQNNRGIEKENDQNQQTIIAAQDTKTISYLSSFEVHWLLSPGIASCSSASRRRSEISVHWNHEIRHHRMALLNKDIRKALDQK